jgi:hypothetical protein
VVTERMLYSVCLVLVGAALFCFAAALSIGHKRPDAGLDRRPYLCVEDSTFWAPQLCYVNAHAASAFNEVAPSLRHR